MARQCLWLLVLVIGCEDTQRGDGGDADADAGESVGDSTGPDAVVDAVVDAARDAALPEDAAPLADVAPPVDAERLVDAGPDLTRPDLAVDAQPDAERDAQTVDGAAPPVDAAPEPDAVVDAAIPPGHGRINEVQCRGEEWVEVLFGEVAVEEGWVLTDRLDDPAREFVFRAAANAFLVLDTLPFGVGCEAESLYLVDPDGTVLDTIEVQPHPLQASWGRLPDEVGDFGPTEPTPGRGNAALRPDPLRLNEVRCAGQEWVEIHNPTEEALDLEGAAVSDATGRYELGPAVIEAGGFLRVPAAGIELPFGIACEGDRVQLWGVDGGLVDQVELEAPPPGATWGRLPDGVGDWQATAATPSAPNTALQDFSVVFNEVHCRDEWVELHNTGAEGLDLAGWRLTDRPEDPARHRGLAGALEAGGFVRVGDLPFGIGCGSDHLVLMAPSGQWVDEVEVGEPPRGASEGRLPDGAGPWETTRPTPGASNQALGNVDLRINEVDCQGSEWVELLNVGDAPADLSEWRLTQDPETGGHRLEGLVQPGELAVVEQQGANQDGFEFAIACGRDTLYLHRPDDTIADQIQAPREPPAFTWGRLPDGGDWARTTPTKGEPNGVFDDAAAVLFRPMHVTSVDITAPEASLAALRAAPRVLVPGQAVITIDGVATEPLPIGFRIKGRAGSFRQIDQKPALKVKFNFNMPGGRFLGLKRLTLNNQVQDPSTINEFTAYSIFRALGVAAPRVGYAFVTLNGLDYGLYAQIESPDDIFMDRWFASTVHLFEGAYGQDFFVGQINNLQVDIGDPEDRSSLARITDLLDAPPEEGFFIATAEIIDWPQVITAMATEVYIGHWDGYAPTRNNYYFHFDAEGVLRLMPWGTDQTFSSQLDFHGGRGRLMEACQQDHDCRAIYDQTMRLVRDTVVGLNLPPQIREVAEVIRPFSLRDPRRAYDLNGIAQRQQRTIDFLTQRAQRAQELLGCLEGPDADSDNDGFLCDADCNNNDPLTFPGAPEICGDNIDQDCNGRADDGFDCPDCLERVRGTRSYYVCPTPRTYDEAGPHCAEIGAERVVIDSAGEARWLSETAHRLRRQDYWLGLDDRAEEGSFVWDDGSPLGEHRFAQGQPDNGGEADCAHVLGGRDDWADRPCGHRIGVLCEAPCVPGTDRDQDGAEDCGQDCNDEDPNVHPDAEELCDGIDNNCNGVIDELGECICVPVDREGRSYHICTQPLAYLDGREACRSLGQDLAIINDADEDAFLYQRAIATRRLDYWFGFDDIAEEGTFTWSDGSVGGYDNWNGNEPNNAGGNEDCAHMWANGGRWNDLPCDRRLGFICEEVDE